MTVKDFQFELIGLNADLMRFASSLISNKEDSKDLVQETYLKALTYCHSFEDNSNMKAWTFTIMKNTFINNYRKNVKQNISVDSSGDQYQINSKYDNNDIESQYSHNEINNKIEELDQKYRIPFQMHITGYKYHEISKSLNLNIGTVKSRIFLSRKKLISILSK